MNLRRRGAAPPCDQAPGAVLLDRDRWRFAVWAPARQRVEVVLLDQERRCVPMQRGGDDVHRAVAPARPGTRYLYRLDDAIEVPDPASRSQPEGVHGPSEILATGSNATDVGFRCPGLSDLALYELHVGTFTVEGTFAAAADRLDLLVRLGINAVSVMPVAQFPGERNWGYDGVYAFAVQNSYGGPEGLRAFVDASHERGIAVILDVVYNHVGPEGNYLGEFGPYFNERYRTPWGPALNFDGPGSEAVRWHFIQSALYFITEIGVDGLRVDAVHAFVDTSARPFLAELTTAVERRAEKLRRRVLVIAESDLNDARVLMPPDLHGYGMHAQWTDDFHHALHTLLTGERRGYYRDFGRLQDLADAYRHGWVYRGQWSEYRRRRHGNSPDRIAPERFVVHSQTHDQVGNRARGDRLGQLVSFPKQKLAACAVLLSPFVPMLFMGQEYGETAPFCYFTSHGDANLAEAVRKGRQEEFAAFGWHAEDIPDPQDPTTFEASRLDWTLLENEPHRTLWELHRELLALRQALPALRAPGRASSVVEMVPPADGADADTLLLRRTCDDHSVLLVLSFASRERTVRVKVERPLYRMLDTEEARWGGTGSLVADLVEPTGTAAALAIHPNSCVVLATTQRET